MDNFITTETLSLYSAEPGDIDEYEVPAGTLLEVLSFNEFGYEVRTPNGLVLWLGRSDLHNYCSAPKGVRIAG